MRGLRVGRAARSGREVAKHEESVVTSSFVSAVTIKHSRALR